MKGERISNGIIATILIVVIVLPLITFNWKQGVLSKSENRYLTSFPKLFNDEGYFSETVGDDLTSWFKDNLGLRDEYINLSGRIEYNLFHRSPSYKVELGKDGWLYYTQEHNIEIASGEYPDFDETILEEICEQQKIIERKLKKQGIDYVLILPPSKVSIYPEFIQSGDYSINNGVLTPVDILANYIEAHSDIKVVRLKDALLEAKESTQNRLYYKTDTHWNQYGQYVGYCEIVSKLNEFEILNSSPVSVTYTEINQTGDLSAMIGNNANKYKETVPVTHIETPTATIINTGEVYESMQDVAKQNAFPSAALYENAIVAPRMLLYGDSMFNDALQPLLAENMSSLSYYWGFNITQEAIDIAKPDVVCLEIGERLLSGLDTVTEPYAKTIIDIDSDNMTMDIYFRDKFEYDKMWFPTWSATGGQEDLVWYPAERNEEGLWHVQINLKEHGGLDIYNIHFYSGKETWENNVYAMTYNTK